METALLLIAFQNNYFKKGSHPIKEAKACAKVAAKLLDYFRENGLPIVHILHTGNLEELSAINIQPHKLLEPQQEEPILVMSQDNAFADNKLHAKLRELGIGHLMIAGLGIEKQVWPTVWAATAQNYTCTLLEDACAAAPLKFNGEKIKADVVQKVVLASLKSPSVNITTAKLYLKAELKKRKKELKLAQQQEVAQLQEQAEEGVEKNVAAAKGKKKRKSLAEAPGMMRNDPGLNTKNKKNSGKAEVNALDGKDVHS